MKATETVEHPTLVLVDRMTAISGAHEPNFVVLCTLVQLHFDDPEWVLAIWAPSCPGVQPMEETGPPEETEAIKIQLLDRIEQMEEELQELKALVSGMNDN